MVPQDRNGQGIKLPRAVVAFLLPEDRQYYRRARACQRAGENRILPSVRRTREIHIEGHRSGASAMQLIDHAGVVLPRPRPTLDRGHACRIHFDDVQLAAGGALAHGEARVLKRVLERLQCARYRQDAHDPGQK